MILSAVNQLQDYGDKLHERLKEYQSVNKTQYNIPKLVGMFLEGLTRIQIEDLLHDDEYLTKQIQEANDALKARANAQGGTPEPDNAVVEVEEPAPEPGGSAPGAEGVDSSEPATAPDPSDEVDEDKKRGLLPEVPALGAGGAENGEPATAPATDAAGSDEIAPATNPASGMGTNNNWASRVTKGAAKEQPMPPPAPAPNAAGSDEIKPAKRTWAALAGKRSGQGQKQEGSGATTDEDRRYVRLFEAMEEIVKQLKQVPVQQKEHCGIVAQALMIRYCLSEWFKNKLHTFTKSKDGFITSCEIDIKTLMLSVEDVTERTLQEQAVCIFPKGTKPFYSMSTKENLLLHKHQALDMYNNFTQVVTKVFKQYFPDFGAENKYQLPIPFVFAGALESRRDANRDSDDLIDEMIKSWPKQKTNISLENFLTQVPWSVQAFAFKKHLELQNVNANGSCFFYAIAWMTTSVDKQQTNSDVEIKYTPEFEEYFMLLKREILQFMLDFLTVQWKSEHLSKVTQQEHSTSFLEIMVDNYDNDEPPEIFKDAAETGLQKSEYKTQYYQSIDNAKLRKVLAVYYHYIDSNYNRYGDMYHFAEVICSIFDIKEGMYVLDNIDPDPIHFTKCCEILPQNQTNMWDNAILNIRHRLEAHGARIGVPNMYLWFKRVYDRNSSHFYATRPVDRRVQDQRRAVMSNLSQQLQRASAPQQAATSSNASAYFGRENPQASAAPHQDAAHETRLARSAGAAGARKHAPSTSSTVAAEVAELRQIASARNAAKAATAASKQAPSTSSTIAAEVAELRQIASARNAANAAKAASKQAPSASSTVAAEVAQLRQIASARNAANAAKAASKQAPSASSTVAEEVKQTHLQKRIQELRQEAAESVENDALNNNIA
jgi:hypothetical protein